MKRCPRGLEGNIRTAACFNFVDLATIRPHTHTHTPPLSFFSAFALLPVFLHGREFAQENVAITSSAWRSNLAQFHRLPRVWAPGGPELLREEEKKNTYSSSSAQITLEVTTAAHIAVRGQGRYWLLSRAFLYLRQNARESREKTE